MFQARTSRAEQSSVSAAAGIKSHHSSPITCMRARASISRSGNSNSAMQAFSTTGADGRIVLWELSSLNIDMAALGI
jgi:hypothetical protein